MEWVLDFLFVNNPGHGDMVKMGKWVFSVDNGHFKLPRNGLALGNLEFLD